MRIKIDKSHKWTLAFVLIGAFLVGGQVAVKVLGRDGLTWGALGLATAGFFLVWIWTDIRDLGQLIARHVGTSLRGWPSRLHGRLASDPTDQTGQEPSRLHQGSAPPLELVARRIERPDGP